VKKDKDQRWNCFEEPCNPCQHTCAQADRNTSPNSYSTVLFHLDTPELSAIFLIFSLNKESYLNTSQIEFKQTTCFNRIGLFARQQHIDLP